MQSSQEPPRITLLQRSAAAAGASIVSAIVVNPLDVVKTRIQSQGASIDISTAIQQTTLLDKWNFAGCGSTCIRRANPSSVCGPACEPITYKGTFDALKTISRTEGPAVLWRGTNVALMMAIPMVGIYLPMYDHLLEAAQKHNAGSYSPLIAGTIARTVAVYCTAPFELIRTRLQATKALHPSTHKAALSSQFFMGHLPLLETSGSMHSSTHTNTAMIRLRVLRSLWTGVGATLARDVPFSALYWAMVEPIRSSVTSSDGPQTEMDVFVANVTAGSVAGGLSGVITTPLDVVKTRMQISMDKDASIVKTMRDILRKEGMAGMFQGWSARSAKAAPACAIVLSAYEMLKFVPLTRSVS